jgi:hypothetical protein
MESLENVQQYYTYYLNNGSIARTSKHFNKCSKYLKNFFKYYNFEYPLKDFSKKYHYNEDYFENIDTQAKAYFLGFVFADGGIYIRKRSDFWIEKSFTINLAEEDKYILEFFKNELGYKGPLYFREGKEFISPINNQKYKRKNQYALSISSTRFVDHLINLGLGNKKTYMDLKIPSIPKELIKDFIRGYFDGDGCFSGNSILFTSKTSSILEDFKSYFKNKFKKPFGNIRYTERNVFIWQFNKEKNLFLNYIYKDATCYLSRKYPHDQLKFRELLETPEEDNQQPSSAEMY